jgi:ferric-dicitrate binding protein FerR (iron transport regulator)
MVSTIPPDRRSAARRASDASVKYTVKELLQKLSDEQTAGFARIEVSLASKADKADVAKLEARLDEHGKAIDKLQDFQHELETAERVHESHVTRSWSKLQRVAASVMAVLTLLAMIFGPVLAATFAPH